MLIDYNKGALEENLEFKCSINWKNVTSVTLSREKRTENLELEELSNIKQQPKFPAGKSNWSHRVSGLFPKRKINVIEKEIWMLKVDGVIIVEKDDLTSINNDYEFFKNEWKKYIQD